MTILNKFSSFQEQEKEQIFYPNMLMDIFLILFS